VARHHAGIRPSKECSGTDAKPVSNRLCFAEPSRIGRDLKRLEKHFPRVTVAELTGARLVGYFEAGRAGLKTYNNRRGIVSTFLKFALQRD